MASLTMLEEIDDVLDYIVRVRENTVKKDRRYLTMAILTMFSAYLPEPVNLDVQAPSSEGKTYVVTEVAKLFPKEDIIELVGATPKSFFYDKATLVDKDTLEPVEDQLRQLFRNLQKAKGSEKEEIKAQIDFILENSVPLVDLENKILIFLDTPDINTLNALKPILSHDEYITYYKYTDKTGKGQIRSKTILLKGWPAVIIIRVTGEKSQEDYSQISSRFLLVSPNMSKEKYREAIKLLALRMGKPAVVVNQILKVAEVEKAKLLINAIRDKLLELRDRNRKALNDYKASIFYIPLLDKIAELFPTVTGRNMRDFKKLLLILQLIAAVNVFKRPILRIGDVEYIIVVKRDWEKAYELMLTEEEKLSIFTGIPKHVAEWFEKVLKPLSQEYNGTLYISDLVENTPKLIGKYYSYDSIRKMFLKPLENTGFITLEPDPEDRRRRVIKILRENLFNGEKIGEYRKIDFSDIFTLNELNRELSELRKISEYKDVKIINYDGNELTIEELYKKYYSDNGFYSDILLRPDKSLFNKDNSKIAEREKIRYFPVFQDTSLEALILRIVKERQPLEVKKLLSVSFVDYSKDDVVKALKHLIKSGKIREEKELLWVSGL